MIVIFVIAAFVATTVNDFVQFMEGLEVFLSQRRNKVDE